MYFIRSVCFRLDTWHIVTIEKWQSQEDLDAHMASPHIAEVIAAAGGSFRWITRHPHSPLARVRWAELTGESIRAPDPKWDLERCVKRKGSDQGSGQPGLARLDGAVTTCRISSQPVGSRRHRE